MRYWVLVASSLSGCVILVILYLNVVELPVANQVDRLILLNLKALTCVGCVVALLQFAPGDYMRNAWLLQMCGYFLLAEADVFYQMLGQHLGSDTSFLIRGGLVTIANLIMPLALVYFARAVNVAGLTMAGSRMSRLLAMLIAAVVAFIIAGESLATSLRDLFGGNYRELATASSAVGDIASFILLAPLVYTILSLRGGTLLWPFVLLTAGSFCWLVYDGVEAIVHWGEYQNTVMVDGIKELCRYGACGFTFAAGLAQRWALRPSSPPTTAAVSLRAKAA